MALLTGANREAFLEMTSVQAATALKRHISTFGGDQPYAKKYTVIYQRPDVNIFKTNPKDAPQRSKEANRGAYNSGPGYNGGGSFRGSRGGFNRGGGGGGNYNNMGNMGGMTGGMGRGGAGGFNNPMMGGGYNAPVPGGFNGNMMGGSFNNPMAAGFNNRGGMMGGMRGGFSGRGGRGGFNNPMAMGGMPNMMGTMGMGGMPNMMGGMGNMGEFAALPFLYHLLIFTCSRRLRQSWLLSSSWCHSWNRLSIPIYATRQSSRRKEASPGVDFWRMAEYFHDISSARQFNHSLALPIEVSVRTAKASPTGKVNASEISTKGYALFSAFKWRLFGTRRS